MGVDYQLSFCGRGGRGGEFFTVVVAVVGHYALATAGVGVGADALAVLEEEFVEIEEVVGILRKHLQEGGVGFGLGHLHGDQAVAGADAVYVGIHRQDGAAEAEEEDEGGGFVTHTGEVHE